MKQKTEDLSQINSESLDEQPDVDREIELRAMANMLRRAQGFSLAFAQCNQPAERRKLVSELRQLLGDYPIAEIELTDPIEHLLDELIPRLPEHDNARALFIYGLEHSIQSDREFSPLVANLNVSRNSFPHYISYPVVLWLPAFAVAAVMRGAPDFFSWRSALFQFPSSLEMLVRFSQDALAADFQGMLNLTLEEKKDRISVIENLLVDYESLPPDRRDRRTEGRLLERSGILRHSLGDYVGAEGFYRSGLEIGKELDDRPLIAAFYHLLGMIAQVRGDYKEAELHFQESLEIKEELEDESGIAFSLNQLGTIALEHGNYEEAEHYYKQNLDIFKKSDDKIEIAGSLHNLGVVAQERGNYEEAEHYYRQSLEIKEGLGDRRSIAGSLDQLGRIAEERGNYKEAERYHRQSLNIFRELGDRRSIAGCLLNLGVVAQDREEYEEAEHCYRQSLEISEKLGDKLGIAKSLHQLGVIDLLQAEHEGAVKLITVALAIFRLLGSPHQEGALRNLNRLQGQVEEAHFEALLKEARADPERVVHEVLESEKGEDSPQISADFSADKR